MVMSFLVGFEYEMLAGTVIFCACKPLTPAPDTRGSAKYSIRTELQAAMSVWTAMGV